MKNPLYANYWWFLCDLKYRGYIPVSIIDTAMDQVLKVTKYTGILQNFSMQLYMAHVYQWFSLIWGVCESATTWNILCKRGNEQNFLIIFSNS